jgi:hypothetical protein
MKQHHIIKLVFFAFIIFILIYRHYKRKKETELKVPEVEIETSDETLEEIHEETKKVFYSINDGNQKEVIYAPKYNKEWFEELDKKYSWNNFDEYDNRFWEYMYQLFDTLPNISGNVGDFVFFNNLNREQKVFYSLLVFTGDTDNGGVSQFFFNRPEFAFAALETFEELKWIKLKTDYEKCLNEFIGTSNSYAKRKEIFNNPNLEWEKRWKAYRDGNDEIKSAEVLEDYFYETEFKKELYKSFVEYIDKNIDKFVSGRNDC